LKKFCNRLLLDKPLVVGHSMGGTVAAISEAECGLNAGGLILIEPIFLIEELYRMMSRVEHHPLATKSLKRTNHWRDEEDLRCYLNSKPLFQSWAEAMLEGYIRHGFQKDPQGGLQLNCPPSKEAALFMGGIKNNPWPMFPRLACPVLLLEGETSENRIYTGLPKVSALMPQGSYALIKEAGHLIPMEKPKEVTSIILNFFREVHV
jgi:lipase